MWKTFSLSWWTEFILDLVRLICKYNNNLCSVVVEYPRNDLDIVSSKPSHIKFFFYRDGTFGFGFRMWNKTYFIIIIFIFNLENHVWIFWVQSFAIVKFSKFIISITTCSTTTKVNMFITHSPKLFSQL